MACPITARILPGLLIAALACSGVACGGKEPRRAASRLSNGYVLFSPLLSSTTYLVDREGRVVHTWESEFGPGASVYLLDNGNLLRPARQPDVRAFHDGGLGGRIQELAWDGTLVWDWTLASEERVQHHDLEPLANGNVLLLAWESKSRDEVLRAGRSAGRVGAGGLWPECVIEVRPQRPDGGEIVWEWHVWDHLIQELDPQLHNYGRIAAHPERVDINGDRATGTWTRALLGRLKALGYVGGGTTPADVEPDFMHANSIAYHPGLDQIVLSVFGFDEIWVVDHGTTSEQAAGSVGGRAGHGGDLLYRWGNPKAYHRGRAADRRLFGQHDARWIDVGLPGAGHLLVFNNGSGRTAGSWSSVLEIEAPLEPDGTYRLAPGESFGPASPVWEYAPKGPRSFYAEFVSGAHRLPDGNTFVTSGPQGRFFEVTAEGEVIWEYSNPYSGRAPNPAGDPPFSVFTATFLAADHPGLAGRVLVPLDPQPVPGRRR